MSRSWRTWVDPFPFPRQFGCFAPSLCIDVLPAFVLVSQLYGVFFLCPFVKMSFLLLRCLPDGLCQFVILVCFRGEKGVFCFFPFGRRIVLWVSFSGWLFYVFFDFVVHGAVIHRGHIVIYPPIRFRYRLFISCIGWPLSSHLLTDYGAFHVGSMSDKRADGNLNYPLPPKKK